MCVYALRCLTFVFSLLFSLLFLLQHGFAQKCAFPLGHSFRIHCGMYAAQSAYMDVTTILCVYCTYWLIDVHFSINLAFFFIYVFSCTHFVVVVFFSSFQAIFLNLTCSMTSSVVVKVIPKKDELNATRRRRKWIKSRKNTSEKHFYDICFITVDVVFTSRSIGRSNVRWPTRSMQMLHSMPSWMTNKQIHMHTCWYRVTQK